MTLAASAQAQTVETGFLDRSVRIHGTDHRYQVYIPREYTVAESWPVILALHGSGERGADGLLQTRIGIAAAVRSHAERYPAIIVFPQAPHTESGWHGLAADLAIGTLDQTLVEFSTDPARIYLTGLSMGGSGAWVLASSHPRRFAAAVIICGFINALILGDGTRFPAVLPESGEDPFATLARQVKHIPIWLFHGEQDPVVPVEQSRRMAEELRKAGAEVRYREFPGAGHNAWEPAYEMEELPHWLFSTRLR